MLSTFSFILYPNNSFSTFTFFKMSTPKTIINAVNRIKTIEKEYSISELKKNCNAIRRYQHSTKTSSVPSEFSKKNLSTYRSYLTACSTVKKYKEKNNIHVISIEKEDLSQASRKKNVPKSSRSYGSRKVSTKSTVVKAPSKVKVKRKSLDSVAKLLNFSTKSKSI